MSSTEERIADEPEEVLFPFDMVEIDVHTDKGMQKERAMVHPFAPGLAVTMHHFGTFDVTHIPTGRSVSKGYERVASAAVALLELANCADWTVADGHAVMAQITEHGGESADVPGCNVTSKGETKPMDKATLLRAVKSHREGDDFPWEDDDTSPHSRIDEIIDHMATKRQAATPAEAQLDRAEVRS